MALTLTEDVIRSRVNLTHDNLEDVKSLSLPGTYHEKIVSLGSALRKFSRLKSLDLSRNALESLEGIDSLALLEKLNLYYNNISSLEELMRLKHTQNLKELDLRLNPVTRSEPDYRLYLIHMLPSLQKLDDRSVRDRERQAALTHYSSSQATEMTYHPPQKEAPPKATHPRVQLTSKIGKPSVLDDDDVAVLDLVAQRDGDMNRPRPLTGSAARAPAMEEYSLEMLKSMSSLGEPVTNGGPTLPLPPKKRPSSLPPPRTDNEVPAEIRERYPNIASIAADDMYRKPEHKRLDPNLQYQDEVDAYSKYKSHGFFTPHPGKESDEENSADISHVPTERAAYPPPPELPATHRGGRDQERDRERGYQDGGDVESRHRDRDRHRRTHSVPSTNLQTFPTERGLPEPTRALHQSLRPSTNRYDAGLVQVRLDDRPAAKRMLFQLLDLVDRYWNGSKSLHQHAKFLSMALDVVEDFSKDGPLPGMQSDVSALKQRVECLQEENATLREHQARNSRRPDMDATSASEAQLKVSLKQACADVERLREELQHYVKENSRLQRKMDQQDPLPSHSGSGAASSSNPLQFDDLSRQNEALSREIEGLRGRLKQFAQMQELASMLQESHKSLVQTNDHLLKEMDEERRRHRHEVEQMHWSYDQLKKTMSYMPSSIQPDSTLVTNNSASRIAHTRDGGDR